jgi:hypothetical protein
MSGRAEREARIQTVSLLVLATIATATALYWLAPVMIPFVLALFLAMGLAPLIDLQIRYLKSPRPLAVLTTFLVGLLILYLLATLVAASIAQLSSNAGAYQEQITGLWHRVIQSVPFERFGMDPEDVAGTLPVDPGKVVGGTLVGLTKALVDLISKGFLVLVFLFFLLSGGGAARNLPGVWSEVTSKIQRYIVTKAVISAATGLAVGTVLAVLGVDLAMVFGLLHSQHRLDRLDAAPASRGVLQPGDRHHDGRAGHRPARPDPARARQRRGSAGDGRVARPASGRHRPLPDPLGDDLGRRGHAPRRADRRHPQAAARAPGAHRSAGESHGRAARTSRTRELSESAS